MVSAYGGKRDLVIGVEDREDVGVVCGIEEFEASKSQNRQPVSIGIHREDVIGSAPSTARKGIVPERQTEFRGSKAGD